MTFQLKSILAFGSIAAMAACGGAGIDPIEGPSGLPSTLGTEADVQADRDFINEGLGFRENDNFFGPRNGDAVYTGKWVTGMTVAAQPEVDALFGDVRMEIDIGGGNNPVTGQVTNLNTAEGNRGIEQLQGALNISGNIGGINRRFDSGASFEGDVSGFFGGDETTNVSIDADISGGWRDSVIGGDPGNVVAGRTTGTASADAGFGDVDITNGQFRADRQ